MRRNEMLEANPDIVVHTVSVKISFSERPFPIISFELDPLYPDGSAVVYTTRILRWVIKTDGIWKTWGIDEYGASPRREN